MIIILSIVISISKKNNAPKFEYYTISKGNVTQEVSVTGKVKPAEAIDFAFEASGKVARVNVKVGDKVTSGTVLASLSNSDVSSSVAQAAAGVDAARSMVAQYQAQLDAQRARLNELKSGARPEEIAMTQIKIDNAKRAVDDAVTNLANAKASADNNLTQVFIDCANSASTAVNSGLNSLSVITDIQYAHFNTGDQDSSLISSNKALAVNALVGGVNAGNWIFQYINSATGGARASVATAIATPNELNSSKALYDTFSALQKISATIDSIPISSSTLTASEKASLLLERTSTTTQMSMISAKIKSIDTQKITNSNQINAAQTALNQANANLDLANQEMVTKKAGASAEAIQAQEAAVKQIEANMSTQAAQIRSAQASYGSASAMLAKTVLTTTIDGTVTKVDVKAGEMSSPSKPVISVMTDAKFKMEANVPEADIAKIKVDNTAVVTLDAYGSDTLFDAKVVKIDPAETVIDGVSTYKVSFEFIKDDERAKSGMTANITIGTAKKDNVLVVPQRSIIKKDGESFVLVSDDGKTSHEVKIEIGLVGSDGNVELLLGLKEGDKIATPVAKK